jgi:hypothetical protein
MFKLELNTEPTEAQSTQRETPGTKAPGPRNFFCCGVRLRAGRGRPGLQGRSHRNARSVAYRRTAPDAAIKGAQGSVHLLIGRFKAPRPSNFFCCGVRLRAGRGRPGLQGRSHRNARSVAHRRTAPGAAIKRHPRINAPAHRSIQSPRAPRLLLLWRAPSRRLRAPRTTRRSHRNARSVAHRRDRTLNTDPSQLRARGCGTRRTDSKRVYLL